MADQHRIKFVDMRIRSRRRTHMPRLCDHPGCNAPADCKAPRGHQKQSQSMFCHNHAAQHNRAHNFFETMSKKEFDAFMDAERTGHKKTWKFAAGPSAKAARAEYHWRSRDPLGDPLESKNFRMRGSSRRSRLQSRCLDALGLEEDADAKQIRARYAYLIKAYHPDSNDGDRSTEPELAQIIKAFKTLKAAGLT